MKSMEIAMLTAAVTASAVATGAIIYVTVACILTAVGAAL